MIVYNMAATGGFGWFDMISGVAAIASAAAAVFSYRLADLLRKESNKARADATEKAERVASNAIYRVALEVSENRRLLRRTYPSRSILPDNFSIAVRPMVDRAEIIFGNVDFGMCSEEKAEAIEKSLIILRALFLMMDAGTKKRTALEYDEALKNGVIAVGGLSEMANPGRKDRSLEELMKVGHWVKDPTAKAASEGRA